MEKGKKWGGVMGFFGRFRKNGQPESQGLPALQSRWDNLNPEVLTQEQATLAMVRSIVEENTAIGRDVEAQIEGIIRQLAPGIQERVEEILTAIEKAQKLIKKYEVLRDAPGTQEETRVQCEDRIARAQAAIQSHWHSLKANEQIVKGLFVVYALIQKLREKVDLAREKAEAVIEEKSKFFALEAELLELEGSARSQAAAVQQTLISIGRQSPALLTAVQDFVALSGDMLTTASTLGEGVSLEAVQTELTGSTLSSAMEEVLADMPGTMVTLPDYSESLSAEEIVSAVAAVRRGVRLISPELLLASGTESSPAEEQTVEDYGDVIEGDHNPSIVDIHDDMGRFIQGIELVKYSFDSPSAINRQAALVRKNTGPLDENKIAERLFGLTTVLIKSYREAGKGSEINTLSADSDRTRRKVTDILVAVVRHPLASDELREWVVEIMEPLISKVNVGELALVGECMLHPTDNMIVELSGGRQYGFKKLVPLLGPCHRGLIRATMHPRLGGPGRDLVLTHLFDQPLRKDQSYWLYLLVESSAENTAEIPSQFLELMKSSPHRVLWPQPADLAEIIGDGSLSAAEAADLYDPAVHNATDLRAFIYIALMEHPQLTLELLLSAVGRSDESEHFIKIALSRNPNPANFADFELPVYAPYFVANPNCTGALYGKKIGQLPSVAEQLAALDSPRCDRAALEAAMPHLSGSAQDKAESLLDASLTGSEVTEKLHKINLDLESGQCTPDRVKPTVRKLLLHPELSSETLLAAMGMFASQILVDSNSCHEIVCAITRPGVPAETQFKAAQIVKNLNFSVVTAFCLEYLEATSGESSIHPSVISILANEFHRAVPSSTSEVNGYFSNLQAHGSAEAQLFQESASAKEFIANKEHGSSVSHFALLALMRCPMMSLALCRQALRCDGNYELTKNGRETYYAEACRHCPDPELHKLHLSSGSSWDHSSIAVLQNPHVSPGLMLQACEMIVIREELIRAIINSPSVTLAVLNKVQALEKFKKGMRPLLEARKKDLSATSTQ